MWRFVISISYFSLNNCCHKKIYMCNKTYDCTMSRLLVVCRTRYPYWSPVVYKNVRKFSEFSGKFPQVINFRKIYVIVLNSVVNAGEVTVSAQWQRCGTVDTIDKNIHLLKKWQLDHYHLKTGDGHYVIVLRQERVDVQTQQTSTHPCTSSSRCVVRFYILSGRRDFLPSYNKLAEIRSKVKVTCPKVRVPLCL